MLMYINYVYANIYTYNLRRTIIKTNRTHVKAKEEKSKFKKDGGYGQNYMSPKFIY